MHFLKINLTHVIPARGYMLEFHRIMLFILDPEGGPALRGFSNRPSV